MSEPVIVAQKLSRRFGATLAVDSLTLTIHAGEIFGFLGHNGAYWNSLIWRWHWAALWFMDWLPI